MERLKSLDPPHKGLRNALSQFSLLAGNTNYKSKLEIEVLKSLGEELFHLLKNHTKNEDTYILAPLKDKYLEDTTYFENVHCTLDSMELKLKSTLASFDGNQSDEIGHEFYLSFTEFHGEFLKQIANEDRNLETDMQAAFTDEELIQQQVDIMKSMDFPTLLLWFKYIVPARRIEENAQVLTAFKSTGSEAFEAVLNIIRPQLSEERYNSIISLLK
jgi:hypothetical protein